MKKLSEVKDTCYCHFGFYGNGCEYFNYITTNLCTYQCGGKGQCLFDHIQGLYAIYTCHCLPGYHGIGCGLFNCSFNCNYNGLCVDNDTCSCYDGFRGKYCDIDCGCGSNGVCSPSNGCFCDQGFFWNNQTCVKISTPVCSKCVFGDCIEGVCVCWAGLTGVECATRTQAPNYGSQIGINPGGVVDWSTQWTFIDLIKQAREWIVQHIDNLNSLYIWSLPENVTLRTDGYPAEVAPDRQYVTLMLRDVQQKWPNSIYHVFYDGDGELDFGMDSSIIINSSRKGKMKIQVSLSLGLNNGVFMKLKKTNPANPLRNIRIIPDGYEVIFTQ